MSTPHTAARARRSRAIGVTPEAEAAKGGALLAAPPAADLAALSTAWPVRWPVLHGVYASMVMSVLYWLLTLKKGPARWAVVHG
eukprot:scaffold106978_cov19-Tisochrysis_lutea.AAC.1